MELHKIISGLNILGREKEQSILLEKIKFLHQGKGGVVLLKGNSEYGQKTIVRDIVTKAGLPFYYGCGTNISTPYDLLQYSFCDLLKNFRNDFDQSLQSVNKLEKSIYKGIVGKATRKFARSSSSIEDRNPTDLNFAVCRHLLKQETPAIFYCEEIQWADASSLDLLLFVMKSLLAIETPILFILHADLNNQGSVKPFSLRQQKVSVLEELKAMNLEIKRRTGTRPKDFITKVEDMEFAEVIQFSPLDDKLIEKIVKKIFGNKLFSENFIYNVCQLAQGSGFFLSEILLYLSRHILDFRNKKWQLKYAESDIQIPGHIDYIIQSNLSDITPEVFNELQRAALLYAPINKLQWENSTSIPQDKFHNAVSKSIQFSILRAWGENYLLFEHDLYRQILIASSPEEELRFVHKNIALSFTQDTPAFVFAPLEK